MTDKQILKEAIEKAIEGGWNENNIQNCTIWFWHQGEHKKGVNCLVIDHSYAEPYSDKRKGDTFHIQINDVIFSRDFAKAFWGEKIWGELIDDPRYKNTIKNLEAWEYHLREMVLEEEPLKYLEKFL